MHLYEYRFEVRVRMLGWVMFCFGVRNGGLRESDLQVNLAKEGQADHSGCSQYNCH